MVHIGISTNLSSRSEIKKIILLDLVLTISDGADK